MSRGSGNTVVRAILAGVAAGWAACATLPPERAAEEELMWEAARECKARYSTIHRIERIDSYGRIHFTYEGSGPDNAGFLRCYGTLLGGKLEAAKLAPSGTVPISTLAAGRTTVTVRLAGTTALVPVTVNESGTADMLLDTGATNTILAPVVAQRLGITVPVNARRRIMYVAGGSSITVPFVRLKSVRVGEFAVEALDVGVYDILPHHREVQGVLGTDFLRHFSASLDQAARRLTLEVKDRPFEGRARAPATPPAVTTSPRPVPAPVWTTGDQWTYRVESSEGTRTWTYVVRGGETVDDVECWVVSAGNREYFHRRDTLALVLEKVNGALDRQYRPAIQHLAWPLGVSRTWEDRYVIERPGQSSSTRALTVAVESEEDVRVPAGTFRAFKIARRHTASGNLSNESWYAPEVKFWVRQRDYLTAGVRTRELTAYKLP